MRFKNKVVLITGSSRGIGRATALEFAKEGANVVINYVKSEKEANSLVNEIKKIGSNAIAVKCDVSKREEVYAMVEKSLQKFQRIDILVNNAGIIRDRSLKKMSLEEWHSVIDTNLNSVFYVTREMLPLLKDGGRIINISSIVGQYGNFGQSNYAAAKAGIIGFTKSLAKELGKKKITVNAVAPGFVKTNLTKNIPFFRKKIINYMTPLKEEASPEDIAHAVAFLASEKARYITGAVINVDGGLAF